MNQENPNQSNEFDLIVKSLEESYSERNKLRFLIENLTINFEGSISRDNSSEEIIEYISEFNKKAIIFEKNNNQKLKSLNQLEENQKLLKEQLLSIGNKLNEKENQVKELSNKLNEKENQAKELLNKLDQKENQAKELSNKLDQKENQANELSNKLDQKENQAKELSNKLDQKENHAKELANKLDQKENHAKELANKLKQKDDFANELENILNQKNIQYKTLNQENISLFSKYHKIQTQFRDLENTSYEIKQQLEKKMMIVLHGK